MYDWLSVTEILREFEVTEQELRQLYVAGRLDRGPEQTLRDGRVVHFYSKSQIIGLGYGAKAPPSARDWLGHQIRAVPGDARAAGIGALLGYLISEFVRGVREVEREHQSSVSKPDGLARSPTGQLSIGAGERSYVVMGLADLKANTGMSHDELVVAVADATGLDKDTVDRALYGDALPENLSDRVATALRHIEDSIGKKGVVYQEAPQARRG